MTLSDAGSWASFVGLALNFVTFLAVFNIKKSLTLRHSAVDALRSLKSHASRLVEQASDYNKKIKDIKNSLALAKVDLKDPHIADDPALKGEVVAAIALIEKYLSDLPQLTQKSSIDRLWEIITAVNVITETMDKDQRNKFVRGG